MKKLLLLLCVTGGITLQSVAETVTLQGVDYEVETKIDRLIGPGIRHSRYRLPSFPLNINVLTVDLNNPYNRIETTTANENSRGTEKLVAAAERQSYANHRAIAGANGNFWTVTQEYAGDVLTGTAHNGSLRNGKLVVESNQHRDQWDGGTMRTGVAAMSFDKTMHLGFCTSAITVTSDKIGVLPVHQCNKGVYSDELAMYNSFYGAETAFLPVCTGDGKLAEDVAGDATEVILDIVEGQSWNSGEDILFTVAEIRKDAGKGSLGAHDLALVGRGEYRDKIASLEIGDQIALKYTWTFNPGTENEKTPKIEQVIGSNAFVMSNGVLNHRNEDESYNTQIYSRTGYGSSADGKTLYIIVIDKSSDPVYGLSAGCNTSVMCEFVRTLGCTELANFDAGGSAQMLINGQIENRTTESLPRAVNNGWLVYSIAPEDADDYNTVAALAFDESSLQAPIYSSYTPTVIAYNRYGNVLDYDFKDFTLSCASDLGSCEGNTLTAGGKALTGELTASYGDVSTTKDICISDNVSEFALRLNQIHLDLHRSYEIEVSGAMGEKVYAYDPATIMWTTDPAGIVSVDANGVISGITEGTTTLTGTIGDFVASAVVTVEEANASEIAITDWSSFTAKGSSGISASMDGSLISYNYKNPRNPYVSLNGDVQFYSLPDEICLEFNSSLPLTKVSADMRSSLITKVNEVTISPVDVETFEANTDHTVTLPLDGLFGHDDIATYPVSLKYIRFYTTTNASNKGDHTINVKGLWAKYNQHSGVESVITDSTSIAISSNPVSAGTTFLVSGSQINKVEIYTTSGALYNTTSAAAENVVTVVAPSTPGAYVIRTSANGGVNSSILLVK